MQQLFSIFGASELLRVAIGMEQKGEQFYVAAAEKTRNEKAREIFQVLATAEQYHARQFTELASKLPVEESLDSKPGEFESYARALLETSVFSPDKPGWELANRADSDLAAVDAALAFEKDTILFLNDMLDYAKDAAVSILDAILKQEKQHVISLTELRKGMAAES